MLSNGFPATYQNDMTILLIFSLLGLVFYFSSALSAGEIALAAVYNRCANLQLQLIDHCVVLERTRIIRDKPAGFKFKRFYTFEFSVTGLERYQGRVILSGDQVLFLEFDPYREIFEENIQI